MMFPIYTGFRVGSVAGLVALVDRVRRERVAVVWSEGWGVVNMVDGRAVELVALVDLKA